MKKTKLLLPLTLAFAATLSGAVAANSVKASAASDFAMLDGSAILIRVNPETDKYGIKFVANVGEKVEGATYKVMILPVEYVEKYEADTTADKKDLAAYMLDLKAAHPEMPLAIASGLEVDANGYVSGSIVDIRWANLTDKFVGAAYYEKDGEVVCATLAEDGKRSVVDVAVLAIESGDYKDDATVTSVLEGFIYNAIQEQNGVSFEEKDAAGNEAKIAFGEATKSVYVGDEFTVNYAPYIAAGLAEWSSTDATVASVEAGKVVALKEGTTTIGVSLLDLSASYTLEVKKAGVENLAASGSAVTWDAVEGASYLVSLNGGAEEAVTTNSYTLTQDGVYDISVKAVKNGVAGDAATIEDYMYTADDIKVGNMKNVSFTKLTHEEGNITFTSEDGIASRNIAGININGDYTNEFIKVTFTATGVSMAENGVALGLRGVNSASALCDPMYTGGWLLNPEAGNGGYFSTCFVDSNGTFHHAVDYLSGALGAVFETLQANIDLKSGFTSGEEYSYVYGAIGSGENTSVYFGIYHEDTLMNLYRWDWSALNEKYLGSSYNYASFPTIRDSGSFHVWYSNASTTTTIAYEIVEDASSILAAYDYPTATVNGNTVTWTNVAWATGCEISVDGGEWTKQTENSYTVTSYGSHTVSVRAYNGEILSEVATVEFIYSPDNVTVLNATNLSFTQTEAGKGSVSLTAPGAYRTGESKFILKNQYDDEFIKVGFTIAADGFDMYTLGLAVGLRENAETTDPVNSNHNIRYFTFNDTTTYVAFCQSASNLYSDHGGAKYETTQHKSVNLKSMAKGTYYMVCGIVDSTAYYLLLDDDDTLVYEVSWNITDAVTNSAISSAPATSGWFSIYSWKVDTAFTYEIITAEEAFGANIVMNIGTKSVTKANGVNTVTFTPADNVTAEGNQKWPTAVFGERTQYTDAFVKVGFTAISENLQNNHLYVQLRSTALSATASCWSIWPYDNGASIYVGYRYGSTSNTFISLGSYEATKLTVGAFYYMVAGINTDSEGVETMYFAIVAYDKATDTETVIAKNSQLVSTSSGVANGATMPASGYFAVQSTYLQERTITYQVITDKTEMSKYM